MAKFPQVQVIQDKPKGKIPEVFNTAMKDALQGAMRQKNASNGHTITLKPKATKPVKATAPKETVWSQPDQQQVQVRVVRKKESNGNA